ncbi:allatostatin-A receptor-like [Tubulanus polymorphus]|uniref:allatostatin-A receptor-like n=1 Tax=Tubulanus polymorphus TaxID=672921 RepID=UPI003DA33DE1
MTATGDGNNQSATVVFYKVRTIRYWGAFLDSSNTASWLQPITLGLFVIIYVMGMVGNSLSCAVMVFTPMKRHSFSVYIFFLSVSDTLVLNICLLRWLSYGFFLTGRPTPIRIDSFIRCKLIEYLPIVVTMISSWLIVLVCLERLVAVVTPFLAKQICRRRTSLIASCFVFGFCFTSTAYMAVCVGYDHVIHSCVFECDIDFATNFLVTSIIWQYLPMSIISVSNVCIIVVLCKSVRNSSKMGGAGGSKNEKSRQVTVMLLVTCIAFIIFIAPDTFLHIIYPTGDLENWFTIDEFLSLWWLLNYTVNLYLYAITGREVRESLKKMFQQILKRLFS